MTSQNRTLLIMGAGILVGLCLLCITLALLAILFLVPVSRSSSPFLRRYESNGQRIYFTATSESGDPISADMDGMHRMSPSNMACADCHGADGQGGTIRMMMANPVQAPDIRFHTLTSEEGHEGGGEEHPSYTEESLKRAITQGINPAGEPLEWPMPRWEMSERDLDDLFDFLKTLE